jgi:hypothetical protein
MHVVNRTGTEIRSVCEWGTLAKPAAERHWVEGRSAYELAADWIDGDAAERAIELLSLRPELAGIVLIEGIAEKKTRFDDIPSGPRSHDLLVHARTHAGPLVIGVEGKADEPFDHPLWRWRQRALRQTPTTRAPVRLDNLTTVFFGSTIDADTLQPSLACLGYQLLSGLAGTLADAKSCSAANAVLLIHEFRTGKTDDRLKAANAFALEVFLQRLAPDGIERSESSDGWITEPISVRGDGKWMPRVLPVSVAKLVTTVA